MFPSARRARPRRRIPAVLRPLLYLIVLAPALGAAQGVIRYPLPHGSKFPIAAAVEVPAGRSIVYLSGMVAPQLDAKAPKDSVAAYGDTETQTVGALKTIEAELAALRLTLADVVQMHVFLAGDPAKGGKMDFAGFMRGYLRFFGTAKNPNLPARSAMQVAALANPGFLVEIEVTAVRP